jgi:hypothetical protein
MKKIIFVITVIFLSGFSKAQYLNHFLSENDSSENQMSKLVFSFKNVNFFKNNEFFNNFYEGYTLIGYFAEPEIIWHPVDKIAISGGTHFQKYSGIKGFSEICPVFSFAYSPFAGAEIRFGTLDNNGNHELEDQIYFSEKFLTDNQENGFQLKYKTKRLKIDTWLNWESFIFHGSDYPERLTFGTSDNLKINSNAHKFRLSADLQAIITHRGGQINVDKQPILSMANFLLGLNCDFNINNFNIRAKEEYLPFVDISPSKNLPYLSGYAFISGFDFLYKGFELDLNHRYGKYFISSRGDPLYMSISTDIPGYKEPNRVFVVGNLFYKKEVYPGVKLGLGCDGFYDLYNKVLDYTYSFYISFRNDTDLSKIFKH